MPEGRWDDLLGTLCDMLGLRNPLMCNLLAIWELAAAKRFLLADPQNAPPQGRVFEKKQKHKKQKPKTPFNLGAHVSRNKLSRRSRMLSRRPWRLRQEWRNCRACNHYLSIAVLKPRFAQLEGFFVYPLGGWQASLQIQMVLLFAAAAQEPAPPPMALPSTEIRESGAPWREDTYFGTTQLGNI